MKKVSVVILNWNGEALLKSFLGGVVCYTQNPLFEVVVADNGSTDGSVEWVRSNFSEVKLIELSENFGFTGGYNRAIEQLDSEYIVLLNSDIEIKSNWLEPLVDILDNNCDVAAVMPKILSQTNPQMFEYAGASGGYIDKYCFPFCRGRIIGNVENDLGQYDSVENIFWASGAAMVVRRELYQISGGLDEMFFAHMEEIDLCWRFKNMGYRVVVEPKGVVYHVGGATLPYQSSRKLFLNHRNNLFMMHKNILSGDFKRKIFVRMLIDGVIAVIYLLTLKFDAFNAIIKSHNEYRANIARLDMKRAMNMAISVNGVSCSGQYQGSIILAYLFGKKIFSKLKIIK